MTSLCVVTQQLGKIISGPGLHAANLVASLVADGHTVWVVAPEDQRPPGALPFSFSGVRRPPIRSHARWFPLSWEFNRAIQGEIQQHAVELVHFTDGRDAFFARLGVPALGNINDIYPTLPRSLAYYRRNYQDWLARWAYYALARLGERRAYGRLDVLLANSRYTAGVIAAQFPELAGRTRVVYKSVDSRRFAPALARRATQGAHPPRLLVVGGNLQRKGVPDLIRAAPTVLLTCPQAEFWIAGQDPAIAALQALARRLGVEAHFHFSGQRTQAELVELYSQADVFVMPSLDEALGVVFLEAMSAGTPVIGSTAGGIPEIIQDGHNGLLTPPSDPPALAGAILRLLGDPALQDRLRQAGLETARRFSVEKMMGETYSIYQDLLSGVRQRP